VSDPITRRPFSDLFDADKARRDPVIVRLRETVTIPHPLHEVQYGDGVLADTTAGRIRSHGRRVTW